MTRVDLSSLSTETKRTLSTIGMAILAGYSLTEIAKELEVPVVDVSRRLAKAKAEIEDQQ